MPGNRRPCQAYGAGAVRRGIRAIWRKLDCLKLSLQKVQRAPAGKTPGTGAGLCREVSRYSVILRGAGAMPCQGIQGDGRDA